MFINFFFVLSTRAPTKQFLLQFWAVYRAAHRNGGEERVVVMGWDGMGRTLQRTSSPISEEREREERGVERERKRERMREREREWEKERGERERCTPSLQENKQETWNRKREKNLGKQHLPAASPPDTHNNKKIRQAWFKISGCQVWSAQLNLSSRVRPVCIPSLLPSSWQKFFDGQASNAGGRKKEFLARETDSISGKEKKGGGAAGSYHVL